MLLIYIWLAALSSLLIAYIYHTFTLGSQLEDLIDMSSQYKHTIQQHQDDIQRMRGRFTDSFVEQNKINSNLFTLIKQCKKKTGRPPKE